MATLADIEVDWRDKNLIKELYVNSKAFVMIGETLSEACSIGRRVRQGCSLSPLLFIICDATVVREICHKCAISIRIEGKIVNILRYADDKTVVASSQKGLQELMNRRIAVTKEYDMRINVNKTKGHVYTLKS